MELVITLCRIFDFITLQRILAEDLNLSIWTMLMDITRPEQLGAFIKDYRSKNGLTQSDIAKQVGVRTATVSDFENKPQSCKLETFF